VEVQLPAQTTNEQRPPDADGIDASVRRTIGKKEFPAQGVRCVKSWFRLTILNVLNGPALTVAWCLTPVD